MNQVVDDDDDWYGSMATADWGGGAPCYKRHRHKTVSDSVTEYYAFLFVERNASAHYPTLSLYMCVCESIFIYNLKGLPFGREYLLSFSLPLRRPTT